MYVGIICQIRSHQRKKIFVVSKIWEIKDFNQITHHHLKTFYFSVIRRKGYLDFNPFESHKKR